MEAWLRGPIEGVPAYLMPAAHALVQALEDLESAASDLDEDALWSRPGGAASVGFHLRHIAGVLDRLLTYARGEPLSEAQLLYLRREGEPGDPPASVDELLHGVHAAADAALAQIRSTPVDSLLEPRAVGRKRLPSTVLGLISHATEHAQRHTGQVVATAKVVRSSS